MEESWRVAIKASCTCQTPAQVARLVAKHGGTLSSYEVTFQLTAAQGDLPGLAHNVAWIERSIGELCEQGLLPERTPWYPPLGGAVEAVFDAKPGPVGAFATGHVREHIWFPFDGAWRYRLVCGRRVAGFMGYPISGVALPPEKFIVIGSPEPHFSDLLPDEARAERERRRQAFWRAAHHRNGSKDPAGKTSYDEP